MRFMLVINIPESVWVEKDAVERIVAWKERLAAKGVHVTGNPLQPAGMANTVSLQSGGEFVIDDGPMRDDDMTFFAFEIIQCADMAEALEVAKTHPVFALPDVHIEVRCIWDEMAPEMLDRACHG